MKKIVLSLMLAVSLAACGEKTESPKENEKPVVKIGVSLPLSGPMAYVGKVLKTTVSLVEKDLSDEIRNEYEFIIEDNSFDTKRAAMINNKFFNNDKVDAILDVGSKVGLITYPLADKNKVIHISLATEKAVAKGAYSFINWAQPSDTAKKMVDKILKDKINNIVIFTQEDQAMVAISDELKRGFENNNIKYIEKKNNHGEKDFNTVLNDLMLFEPQLFILLEYTPSINVLIKRIKEMNFSAQVTSVETFGYMDNKEDIEGLWYSDAPDIKNEYRDKFIRHNKSENTYGVGYIYDSLNMLVQAFENATDNNVLEAFKNIKKYEGVVGTLEQDEQGVIHSQAVIKKIVNGQPVVVEE
ncbi:MAG: ABC transporter substrate-binding protein [Alphaproteobacteria bacterium]|nr:ABC transporter substrate-binding protein [Alphaproteobacteria bacterium]